MIIQNKNYYYPAYISPDDEEIVSILTKKPDTIRGFIISSGPLEGFIIVASGYGHTHESIRKLAIDEGIISKRDMIDCFIICKEPEGFNYIKGYRELGLDFICKRISIKDLGVDYEKIIRFISYYRNSV